MLREIARACEDASWDDDIRVVVVTGTGPRVLRRRRPALVGRGPARQLERVLEVVRRLQGHARPAARDRQADDRARQRDRRRRRQRAADGVRPLGDGRHGLHPPRRARSTARCRPAARRSGSSSWSATAARARSSSSATRSRPRRPRSGGSSTGPCPEAELDAAVDEWVEKLAAQAAADDALREAAAERLARPRVAPDRRPRARLARLSMLGDEAQDAVRAFLDRDRKE